MHQLLSIPHTAYAAPFPPQPTPTERLGGQIPCDTMTMGGRGGTQNLDIYIYIHTHIYILNIHTYAHMYTKKSSSSRAMFFSSSIEQCVYIYRYMYLYLYVTYNAFTYYIKDRNSHAGLGPVLTICPHLCFPNLQG